MNKIFKEKCKVGVQMMRWALGTSPPCHSSPGAGREGCLSGHNMGFENWKPAVCNCCAKSGLFVGI